ncbi:hypothetical protein EWM64_g6467 [Hericium alpestre]|uniref:Protein-S-isoprenylcysteine O-methyltransferase n=1 Tax=Hericium alpestre TaxID=135208 RepID=A0A4Y9ZSL0_9AGAM|nr:hypothetical protein EWM64_g6467 [Hericium alpestre]
MSLLKVPLLLVSSVGVHIALTSPNPPASSSEVSKVQDRWGKLWIKWGPASIKALYWILSLCEVTIICIQSNPSLPYTPHIFAALVHPSTSSSSHSPTITAPFMAGWALITSAAVLRLVCYRTLGRFFTFELSLRDKHKLVTGGPYAWVRHPSYTGGVLTFAGYLVCVWGPGSWLHECGWLSTVRKEDEFLRQEFGVQWDDWVQRVCYRLVPRIY